MARHVIYLNQELEALVSQFAKEHAIDPKFAIRMMIKEASFKHQSSYQNEDIKGHTQRILCILESILPEVSFLSETTRSSLLGKSENPLLDGDLAAQKSRRYLASLLQDITLSNQE